MSINEKDVLEMMELSGQEQGEKSARLYLGLVIEEVSEMLEAEGYVTIARHIHDFATDIKNGLVPERQADLIGGFDGGIDTLWVTIGYMLSRNYPIAEGWKEVARSNGSKRQLDGTLKKDANGKIIKGPFYTPPDLIEALNRSGYFG